MSRLESPATDTAMLSNLDEPQRSGGKKLKHRGMGVYPYLFVIPLVAFAVLVFIVPIVNMAVSSLFPVDPATGTTSFSVDAFQRVFEDDYAREMVWRSIRVGVFTTLLALVLAYPVTLWMRQISPRTRGILVTIMLSPLLMSVVVRTLGWVVLLSPGGFVNELLGRLGLPEVRFLYTEGAIIFGLTQVFLGFMVLSLLTSVLAIPDNVIAASGNLGASKWQTLWRIVIPMSRPGILAGAAIVFPLAASSYVTPALLGGSKNPVLATEVYNQAIHLLNFGRGSAISLVLFAIIALGIVLLGLAARRRKGTV